MDFGAYRTKESETYKERFMERNELYPTAFNPFLIQQPDRPLPEEMAVVGAGNIGPDIAYYLKAGLPDKKLYLVDIVEGALKAAEKRFQGYTQKSVEKRKLTEAQGEAILNNIVYTSDYGQLKNCGLVIEAATENISLKQKIFADLEAAVSDDAVLTSNTSSIPADRIFLNMKHPERATVTHFFAPAWRSLAVEVINWKGVSRDVLDWIFWFFAQTGKMPVITDNVISFMLNRIFENWANEAVHALDKGTAAQIDKVAEEFVFGGPLFVLSIGGGNPLVYEANTRKMEEGDCYKPAEILRSVAKWASPKPGSKVDVPDDVRKAIRGRFLGLLFSQAFDIADRGIGLKEDLNLGAQIALGFREGPYDLMKRLGEEEVTRICEQYDKERPGFPRAKQPFSAYQDFRRHIVVDDKDGVRILTIRRPQAMNAINDEINKEILTVLQEGVDDPSVKGFILTGYGKKAFSAGADIGSFPETLGNREAAAEKPRVDSTVLYFMDQMEKPIVAAINGMAMGGGLEIALRCHSMVAVSNAFLQFPEITLGISPGVGGCVVPYRKWPAGAALFHEMICLAKRITAQQAAEVGMVSKVVDDYGQMIAAAMAEVDRLQGKTARTPDGSVEIPEIVIPENPMAGKLALSREAIGVIAKIIKGAAAAETFAEALEIGYQGAGEIACTDAAREGVSAFLQKRKPEFKK